LRKVSVGLDIGGVESLLGDAVAEEDHAVPVVDLEIRGQGAGGEAQGGGEKGEYFDAHRM
jgi:hypothetical protein